VTAPKPFHLVIGGTTKRGVLSLADQFKILGSFIKFLWEINAHNITKSHKFLY
jgi:hypothetical protein